MALSTADPSPIRTASEERFEGLFCTLYSRLFGLTPFSSGSPPTLPFILWSLAYSLVLLLAALPHAFQNLDGKFALLAVLQDGAVVCATDLLGNGSIYYRARGDRLYVSTHLGLLLASLPSLPAYDRLGLASILATRTWHSGGTLWEGVGRLPAGGYLVIRPRGQRAPEWSTGSYGSLEDLLRGQPRPANLDVLVEEYDNLLRRSLRRERYGDRVAVMLSSGHDSSAIALALRNGFGGDFGAVTFGSPGSRDLIGGTTLARQLRLASSVAPYDDWDFSTYARHTVSLNGGTTGLQEAYMLPGFEHARANFDTAIVGHLGNWIRYQLERSFRFEQWLDRATRVWGRPTHLVGHYFPSEFARLVAIMRENFARRAHLPPHQARMLRFPVTLGWQSLSFDLAEVFLDISYPFYYRPLMGFAFNLPPAVVVEQKLYDRWYRKVEAEAQTALGGGSMAPTRGPTQATDSRTAVRRVTVLDWPERVGRSLAWLFATVEQHRDDEILRKICLVSLPRYLDGEKVVVPAALQGAAPFLAKRYAERKW